LSIHLFYIFGVTMKPLAVRTLDFYPFVNYFAKTRQMAQFSCRIILLDAAPVAHIPERTCLACGRKAPKPELLRITRDKQGIIALDPQQRLPGRGAYVCRTLACAKLLKKKKGLHRGLRQPAPSEIYESILQFIGEHVTQ
jgi:hypothetical protein